MPQTQAYSVDWDVTVAGQNVDRDVVEVTVNQTDDEPDSATVQLDTSERPHAVEEEDDMRVTLDDGNDVIEFRGRVDAVKDSKSEPLVTIDGREPAGELDDVSAVGDINEDNLFDVIDSVIDTSAGQVRGVTFDPGPLKSQYGTFGNSTVFGNLSIVHAAPFDVNEDTWNKQETTGGQGKSAELVIDSYVNTTSSTFQATLTGQDSDFNEVTATFDLPPGDDADDAYGTSKFKLPLSGGNGLLQEINSISTDVPTFSSQTNRIVSMDASVKNYVKTDWDFKIEANNSVRDALNIVVGYISTVDNSRDWDFRVTAPQTGTPELIVEPKAGGNTDRYVFTEGDNVLRPVANRSLDGVFNMVKVNGSQGTNAWFWAFNGTYYFSYDNPFESGEYPEAVGEEFGSSPGFNDIDQIDMRATALDAPQVDDVFQASDLGEKALQELYRTPVSGVAETTGLHPADPGDEAEIYYPSRGIPAKVQDNVYDVKTVEYRVSTDEAYTKIDWGITEPSTSDMIKATSASFGGGAGGGSSSFTQFLRTDLSESLQKNITNQNNQNTTIQGGGLVGTITAKNSDGTFEVEAEDGTTYSNVRVI